MTIELHALEEEMGIAHLDAEASEEERAAWLDRERVLKEAAEAKVDGWGGSGTVRRRTRFVYLVFFFCCVAAHLPLFRRRCFLLHVFLVLPSYSILLFIFPPPPPPPAFT